MTESPILGQSASRTRTGLLVVGGVLASAVVAGIVFSQVTDHATIRALDRVTNLLIAATILLMLVPLVRASQHWGGQIGRNLQLIGLGLIVFLVSIVPHIEWHVLGAPRPIGPPMLGLSAPWWGGFFHVLTIVSWVVIVYGFYRFWRLARPGAVRDR